MSTPEEQGIRKWRGYAREVHVLIRGDLFSIRRDVVPSEITGRGYRLPNVPAQMMECSASSVRYELKKSSQGMVLCSVMRSNSYGENAGVSRGHSSPTPGVMSRIW